MRTNVVGGIRIVAVAPDGQQLDLGRLQHGQHPDQLLASKGWCIESPCAARLLTDGALELSYDVSQLSGIPSLERADVPRDSGVAPGDPAEPFQRVAAYAIVTSERGLLLTQFSGRTNKPDHWGLPGGGLDEGEGPADGVHREVWEETGQHIELGDLVQVQSQHWIGHSPSGELEDFHAVRIVYRGTCAEPTEPVIHDVGGTTSDARWVPVDELADYSLTSSWAQLHELVGAPQ